MTNSVRNSAVVISIALVLAVVGGCRSNASTGTSEDVLAQDTTLNLDAAVTSVDSSLRDGVAAVVAAPEPSAVATSSTARPAQEVHATSAPSRAAERVARPRASSRVSRRAPTRRSTRVAASGSTRRPRAAVESSGQTVGESSAAIGVSNTAPRDDGTTPRAAVVNTGSQLFLASDDRICAAGGNVGDRFNARLAEPVVATNGAEIPAGSTAVGEIASLETGLDLRIESISFNGRTYQLSSEVTYAEVERVRSRSRSADARKVAGGAAVGAVLGQVLGRNVKSTVIGAAGGAVAGAVIANRTAAFDQCVPDGGRITARLTQPLAI